MLTRIITNVNAITTIIVINRGLQYLCIPNSTRKRKRNLVGEEGVVVEVGVVVVGGGGVEVEEGVVGRKEGVGKVGVCNNSPGLARIQRRGKAQIIDPS